MRNKIEWNKVTWYSKLLAVLVFFIVLLVGIYIGSEIQRLNMSVLSLRANNKHTSAIPNGTFLYENKEYGFSLVLPARWKDYQIEKEPSPFQPMYDEKTKQTLQVEQTHMVIFLLRTVDAVEGDHGNYGGTFVIYIHPQTEWQTNREQNIIDANTHIGSGAGGYLGENNKYAYTYEIADPEMPFAGFSQPGEDPRTEPMHEAENTIIPTFKIISLESNEGDSSVNSIYKNEKFGFEFIKPIGSEIDSRDFNGEEYVAENTTSIYLGSSANVPINIYLKGKFKGYDETTIQSDPSYKKLTINGKTAYRSESYGTSHNWFITTIFFGNKYIYEIQFSNDSKDQKYIDMQAELVNSFKFLE